MPRSRLVGLETEYAIRFTGPGRHPDNDRIYRAVVEAVGELVDHQPGSHSDKHQIFVENGGAFCYEHLPHCPWGGLLEGATPECRGAGELLLYQKAQEALLIRALPGARERLRSDGFTGEIGLLKNCRDAEGHVYGVQENFEAILAQGWRLALYRIGLTLLAPVLFVSTLVTWLAVLVFLLLVLGVGVLGAFAYLLLPSFRRSRYGRALLWEDRSFERIIGRGAIWLSYAVHWPLMVPFSTLLHAFAFREIRREALAFLVSRPILSGAGTLTEDGSFLLSEKGLSLRRTMRFFIRPAERTILDTGNLMKQLVAPMTLQLSPWLALFRRRQRLQLGLADANMIQEAELLKIGTTSLVLDMVEDDFLADAPRLRSPRAALRGIVSDPSLNQAAELRDGTAMTALEIQRFYLNRARAYVYESKTPSLERVELLHLWEELLEGLEKRAFSRLIGRLDWVTKRYLLESVQGEFRVLKTIDLRYHELGEGYLARLEQIGRARTLLSDEAIDRAVRRPPEGTPATFRGQLIRRQALSPLPARVSWHSARIGGRLRGRLVRFEEKRE